jgi:hypothetical protein
MAMSSSRMSLGCEKPYSRERLKDTLPARIRLGVGPVLLIARFIEKKDVVQLRPRFLTLTLSLHPRAFCLKSFPLPIKKRLIPTTMKQVNRFETSALLDAMINRRSRRFAPGMTLDGGPLSYRSKLAPKPFGEEEEAALAFAAWLLKRPQDYPRELISQLVSDARAHRLVDIYRQMRVSIADQASRCRGRSRLWRPLTNGPPMCPVRPIFCRLRS